MHRLTRIAAVAAASGGLLRIVAQFIPYVPESAQLELLYGVIDLGFLFGMVGLLMLAAERIAAPGLVLLLVALAGVASIVGPDKTAFGIDFYLAGSAVFTLALGLATPFLARLPGLKRTATAWAIAALAAVASALGAGGPAFVVAGLALAAGFLLLAPALWYAKAV